jgi:hypothetical protein
VGDGIGLMRQLTGTNLGFITILAYSSQPINDIDCSNDGYMMVSGGDDKKLNIFSKVGSTYIFGSTLTLPSEITNVHITDDY